MVLLAGSGIADLAGASAIARYLIAACPEVWPCLRTRGKGSHFADTVARALDLPLITVVAEEQSLALTCSTAYRLEARQRAPWRPRPTWCWRSVSRRDQMPADVVTGQGQVRASGPEAGRLSMALD
jgi:hypothetical protein